MRKKFLLRDLSSQCFFSVDRVQRSAAARRQAHHRRDGWILPGEADVVGELKISNLVGRGSVGLVASSAGELPRVTGWVKFLWRRSLF